MYAGAVVCGFVFIPLGVIFFALLGANLHHAADFARHSVARNATVRTVTHTEVVDATGGEIWTTYVSLALQQPVAGHRLASLQLSAQQVSYPAGQQLKVLIDPKAPGDAKLAGTRGLLGTELIVIPIWATPSIAFGIYGTIALGRRCPDGTDGRVPDFLNATWRSWAAWLPFFAITGISVYAVTQWPQWWLVLLIGLPVAMLGPVLPALRRYLGAPRRQAP